MLAIVHLSDLHVKDERSEIIENGPQLARSLTAYPVPVSDVVIAVTGDIAFSGLKTQYAAAGRLLLSLKSAIESAGMNAHILTVPGNHDCDFGKGSAIRDALLDAVRLDHSKFDMSFAQACCSPLTEYSSFADSFMTGTGCALCTALYSNNYLMVGAYRLNFHLFNSSWCSSNPENAGTLLIPDAVFSSISQHSDATLNIAMMHHTLGWLNPDNALKVRAILDRTADVVFTGHEHQASVRTTTDVPCSLATLHFEGAVLCDAGSSDSSSYNVAILDLAKKEYLFEQRVWRDGVYSAVGSSSEWLKLTGNTKRSASCFQIATGFSARLNDPGAAFRHPRVERLFLDDIYVPPDFRDIDGKNATKEKTQYKKVGFNDITFDSGRVNHYLVTGSDTSGKTALCSRIFSREHKKGLIPIYIDVAGVSLRDATELQRLVEKQYEQQYEAADIDVFRQLGNDRKLVIVDNFHHLKVNATTRNRVLSELRSVCRNLLVTSDAFFAMDEFALPDTSGAGGEVSGSFRTLQILPFGNVLRSELITRWIEIGQKDTLSHQDKIRDHDELKRTIDSVVGQNLIPAYPFFFLIILQRCEDELPHDIQSSAYGYYYEYLIIRSLRGICKKNEDIDAYYNYITEFANHLFELHRRKIDENEFREFHDSHCRAYRITRDFSGISRDLVGADILAENGGCYRFRYPYVYYFFFARYLANNMTVPQIRERVKRMCERIYQDEFSNIIMFLTHLSKDPFILEQVLQAAKAVFQNETPYQFESVIPEIVQLLDEVPRLVLKDRDVDQERKRSFEDQDSAVPPDPDAAEKLSDESYDLDEAIKDPDTIEHFIMSIKVIRLLGQILKNYYGSLKALPKLELAEEAYMLAFRAIHRFYVKLLVNIDGLVVRLGRLLEEIGATTKEGREKDAKQILFALCVVIPDMYIQEVTRSVASRNLAGTFQDVLCKNMTHGVRLIDLSIKMASRLAFPLEDALALSSDVSKDVLSSVLLKNLVLHHLYMFPLPHSERQSICDRLGIAFEERAYLISGG